MCRELNFESRSPARHVTLTIPLLILACYWKPDENIGFPGLASHTGEVVSVRFMPQTHQQDKPLDLFPDLITTEI